MKAPGPEDRLVDVNAWLTDEEFGYDHWRAAQFASGVSDVKRAALLVVCSSEADRSLVRALVESALAQPVSVPPERAGSVAAIVDAAERIQAAVYDMPAGATRSRLLEDSVVVLQELAKLARAAS